jgi:hypothetical protein
VSGLSTKITAQEQAYYLGQAWEALPEPKRQFTFYVVMPAGNTLSFHIGPHVPTIEADDVQLVHRLWLNLRRDPTMCDLHHSDIVTYALTRMAKEFARDKQATAHDLTQSIAEHKKHRGLGSSSLFDDLDHKPGYVVGEADCMPPEKQK